MHTSLENALNLLLEETEATQRTETVPLLSAIDKILAEDIFSPISVPSFPKSGMDGYAVRSIDTKGATLEKPVFLHVIGEVCAGDSSKLTCQPGTAVRIMTGGCIPEGYDAVIKQEETNFAEINSTLNLESTTHSYTVSLFKEVNSFENYCPIGEDIQKGTLLLEKDKRLTSFDIGILASIGRDKVTIYSPMRVGIISTGNELIPLGSTVLGNQIYNSSAYSMASQIKSAGLELAFIHICPDKVASLKEMIVNSSEQFDVLITTGAVSVGKRDILPETLESLPAKILFRGVSMKPGTPVIGSSYQNKIILSVSGNPFAATINFNLLFWPIAAKFMHNTSYHLKKIESIICEGSLKPSVIKRFVRAYLSHDGIHLYTKNHQSSVFANLIESNGFIEQASGSDLKIGDQVYFYYWN